VRLPNNHIFIDVDLKPGVDFVEAIEASVGSCDVLIVVIGKRWVLSSDEAGNDNPDDFVRLEIAFRSGGRPSLGIGGIARAYSFMSFAPVRDDRPLGCLDVQSITADALVRLAFVRPFLLARFKAMYGETLT
jgi:hypothetical protein